MALLRGKSIQITDVNTSAVAFRVANAWRTHALVVASLLIMSAMMLRLIQLSQSSGDRFVWGIPKVAVVVAIFLPAVSCMFCAAAALTISSILKAEITAGKGVARIHLGLIGVDRDVVASICEVNIVFEASGPSIRLLGAAGGYSTLVHAALAARFESAESLVSQLTTSLGAPVSFTHR